MSEQTLWRWQRDGLIRAVFQAPLEFEVADVEALVASRARIEKARLILKRKASGDIELEDDDLLTTGEAGLLLGLTSNTVAVYIRDGKIKAASRTPGGHLRIRYAAVRAVLEARDAR